MGQEQSSESAYLVDNRPMNPTFTVKLERGQRGSYGWEIKVLGEDKELVLKQIAEIDKSLRDSYGPEL